MTRPSQTQRATADRVVAIVDIVAVLVIGDCVSA